SLIKQIEASPSIILRPIFNARWFMRNTDLRTAIVVNSKQNSHVVTPHMDIIYRQTSGLDMASQDTGDICVAECIHENGQTVISVAVYISPNPTTFFGRNKIVTEDINFKNLCSLWVPRLLTAEHKEKRFASLVDFLIRCKEEGEGVLSRIVTGDET
ncbi:uncharacterized protein TNCV_3193521, partial [Trichonephila clavipes]